MLIQVLTLEVSDHPLRPGFTASWVAPKVNVAGWLTARGLVDVTGANVAARPLPLGLGRGDVPLAVELS